MGQGAFIAAKESHRSEIEPWLGHQITSGGFIWVLADWNYLGVLYWHKLNHKTLYVIEGCRRITDLERNVDANTSSNRTGPRA